MSKPRVLIFGGIGFIGRNLVQYLLHNDLTSKIRVADKTIPALASLSEEQKDIFENKVEFKQINLSRAATIAKAFDDDAPFDYVINLAAETKYSQGDGVYQEYVVDVASTTGNEAAKRGIKHFVEISTAQVYDSGSKPRKEDAKLKPWTSLAKFKLSAEETLKGIPNLPLTILRPALVYGPGDISSITPRLVTAAVYKSLGEKMEFLWDKDLKINTVHIDDVVKAIWHVATKVSPSGAVYNLADSTKTDQGTLCPIIESIFGIKTSFIGSIKSNLAAALAMKTVADTANDKHLKPWSDICRRNNINVTPLTPYIDEELLYNNDLSIDGSAITSTGFQYSHPILTFELVKASLDYHIRNKSFPEIEKIVQ